jgi:hypothetical protein
MCDDWHCQSLQLSATNLLSPFYVPLEFFPPPACCPSLLPSKHLIPFSAPAVIAHAGCLCVRCSLLLILFCLSF